MSTQIKNGTKPDKLETAGSPELGHERTNGELRQSVNANSMQTAAWTDFGDEASHVDHFVHAFLATSLIDGDPDAVGRSISRKEDVMSHLDEEATLKLAHLILDASDIRTDDPAVQVLLSDHNSNGRVPEQKKSDSVDFVQNMHGVAMLNHAIESLNSEELRELDRNARCVDADPEAFFPDKGEPTKEAKQICADCPVKQPCLDYAIAHEEKFGIWGGLSPKERLDFKRQSEPSSSV